MWNWLRRGGRQQQKPAPEEDKLKGAPAHARTKTFSAEAGFVYQYVYRGYRRMGDNRGTEYVFEANRDRKQTFEVKVQLLDAEVALCVDAIGRELINAERYALVKMTLFAALDRACELQEFQQALVPTAVEMDEHLRVLGRV